MGKDKFKVEKEKLDFLEGLEFTTLEVDGSLNTIVDTIELRNLERRAQRVDELRNESNDFKSMVEQQLNDLQADVEKLQVINYNLKIHNMKLQDENVRLKCKQEEIEFDRPLDLIQMYKIGYMRGLLGFEAPFSTDLDEDMTVEDATVLLEKIQEMEQKDSK